MLAVSVKVLVSLVFVCFAQAGTSNHSSFQSTKDAEDITYISTDNLDGQVELSTLNILTTTVVNGQEFSTEETTTHKYKKVLKRILKRPIHAKDVDTNDGKTNKQSMALIPEVYSRNGEVSAKDSATAVSKSDDLMNDFITTTSGNNLNAEFDLKESVVNVGFKNAEAVKAERNDTGGAIGGEKNKKDVFNRSSAHTFSEIDQQMGDEPTTIPNYHSNQSHVKHKQKRVLMAVIKRPLNTTNAKEFDYKTNYIETYQGPKNVQAYTRNEIVPESSQMPQDKNLNLDGISKTLNGMANSTSEQEKLFIGNVTKEEESLFEVTDTTENDLFEIDRAEINASMSAFKKTLFPTVLFPKHSEEDNKEREVTPKPVLIFSSKSSTEQPGKNALEETTTLMFTLSEDINYITEIINAVNTESLQENNIGTTFRQYEKHVTDSSFVNANDILTVTTESCLNNECTEINTTEQIETSTINTKKDFLIKVVEETNKNDVATKENPWNFNIFSEGNTNNTVPTIPLFSEDILNLVPGIDEDVLDNETLPVKVDTLTLNHIETVEETNKNNVATKEHPEEYPEENTSDIVPTVPLLSEDILHLVPGIDEDVLDNETLPIRVDSLKINHTEPVQETNESHVATKEHHGNYNKNPEENTSYIVPIAPLLSEEILNLAPGIDKDTAENKTLDMILDSKFEKNKVIASIDSGSTNLTRTISLEESNTLVYTTERFIDVTTFVIHTSPSGRNVSIEPTVTVSDIPTQATHTSLLIFDKDVDESDKDYETKDDESEYTKKSVEFQTSESSTTSKAFSLTNNVMKIPNPRKIFKTNDQPATSNDKDFNRDAIEINKDSGLTENKLNDETENEFQSSPLKNVMKIPKAFLSSKIDQHEMAFFKLSDDSLEEHHQADSPSLNVTFIVGNIFGTRTNYSIEIILDDLRMFVPQDVTVISDKEDMTLEFTWFSYDLKQNNSIKLNLTGNENQKCAIELVYFKGRTPKVWSDKDIKCPNKVDENDQKWIIQFEKAQINFYNLPFYGDSTVNGADNIDALAAEERYQTRIFHIKISAGICAILTVLGVLFFIVVKKREQRKNSVNLETKDA